jgi:hypothetical protein
MGEEDKSSKNILDLLCTNSQFYKTSHSFMQKTLGTSKNLMFVVILDGERGVLSELGI